jgi:hypothetical protein
VAEVVEASMPSMKRRSNKGPVKRVAVRRSGGKMEERWMGYQPRRWMDSRGECPVVWTMRARVEVEAMTQARVTAWIRARMTDGASLLRVGEGRVEGER